jgi:hypothetical protein
MNKVNALQRRQPDPQCRRPDRSTLVRLVVGEQVEGGR